MYVFVGTVPRPVLSVLTIFNPFARFAARNQARPPRPRTDIYHYHSHHEAGGDLHDRERESDPVRVVYLGLGYGKGRER